ncbi:penicillin acylase family protein [Pendulispora rubella]|uniref:Penicillin acylase family protein n=1 Tax=Pendulispora rubella TaxID=2741070 RepID=A0ABZ2LJV1_9BACT
MRLRNLLLTLSLGPIACMSHVGCNSTGDGIPEAPGPFGYTPKIDFRTQIERLEGPVDVVRDAHGMVHIYATTSADAMRVEGYQLARDRTAQLELIRRIAEGRMAELLGGLSPDLIDSDISARTIGLHRVAKKMYEALPAESEAKKLLDAYADGISQFNARLNSENAEEVLPQSMSLLPLTAFEPWNGADVLAVARFQSQELSLTADEEITQSSFIAKWRTVFGASTDEQLKKRAPLLAQYAQFKPLDTATVLPGFPNDGGHVQSQPLEIGSRPIAQTQVVPRAAVRPAAVSPATFDAANGFVSGLGKMRSFLGERPFTGSNNWVVAPSRTASGHAILASDPHLSLSAPAVFWMVHLNVINASDPSQDMDVAGLAFPGIAGVILGYNRNVGWGATTALYDVTDVYSEKLNGDASGVVFNGQNVPFEKVHETIKVQGRDPIEYDVLMVPHHHGPLVPTIVDHKVVAPDPSKAALSMRWTGMEPTNELAAVFGFMRAKTVEDARVAIRNFSVGAQNWVFADTNGDIFYSSQSQIPKRDKRAYSWDPNTFSGTLPCFVLPGDGTAEWTGEYLPEANVPHAKNPSSGYIATANNDQVGVTVDNDPSNDKLPNGDPMYMGCYFDTGLREARIKKRIEAVGNKMTPEEMASIQGDAQSPLGAELTPKLLEALGHAEEERATPGSRPDLATVVKSAAYDPALIAEVQDVFRRWALDKDYEASAGLNLDDNTLSADAGEALASKATLIFNVWLVRMLGATFDDELGKLEFKTSPFDMRVALVNAVRANDSLLFDDLNTATPESRDERMVTSLLDALAFLKADKRAGQDRNAWRWGTFHTLRFASLVPLWPALSIPPGGDATFPNGFPRHGDGYNVDVATYSTKTRDLSQVDFSYAHGPTQRFVIEMDPAGPRARNALPGGAVWDDTNKHFRDEAELWRRNQNHAVSFTHTEVKAEAETRTLYSSSASK